MTRITLTSYNVKGLNSPEKRTRLLTELRRMKSQIIFLQETHFRNDKTPKLGNRRFPTVYHGASQTAKANGVSILISNQIPWKESKIITDEAGRLLIVKGFLCEQKVTLVNLYLPNEDQVSALETYLNLVHQNKEGILMVGGDLNMALDPALDVSKGVSHLSYIKLRRAKRLLQDLQLMDTWRTLHAHDRDYTFFSAKHKTYTRIDYVFLSQNALSCILEASIGSFTLSHHAPTNCVLEWGDISPREWNWKMNETLLKEPEYENQIAQEVESFFINNKSGETTPFCRWEAHKCYIRGILISLGAHRKRSLGAKLDTLLGEIRILEQAHKKSHAQQTEEKLSGLRGELNLLLIDKAKAKLARCRRVYYEYGNKPSRVLANALRETRARNHIERIKTQGDTLVSSSQAIAKAFRDYYANLYQIEGQMPTSRTSDRWESAKEYILASGMPKIPEEGAGDIDGPITIEEFSEALKSLKPGKAPGPDGYTLLYYKTFSEKLAPQFLAAFNSIRDGQTMPMETLMAHITVIPKEGKDPALCASYLQSHC